MKRTGVDRATTAISSKELGKGGVEIVRNEGSYNVLFAIRDDKEMAGPDSIEVVFPSGPWVNSWLRAIGTWSSSFYVSAHRLSLQRFGFGLLVQDYGHGGDGRRGAGRNVFNESRDDGRSVCRVSCRRDWGRD